MELFAIEVYFFGLEFVMNLTHTCVLKNDLTFEAFLKLFFRYFSLN